MTDREKIIEHINTIDQLSHQPGNEWLLAEEFAGDLSPLPGTGRTVGESACSLRS